MVNDEKNKGLQEQVEPQAWKLTRQGWAAGQLGSWGPQTRIFGSRTRSDPAGDTTRYVSIHSRYRYGTEAEEGTVFLSRTPCRMKGLQILIQIKLYYIVARMSR